MHRAYIKLIAIFAIINIYSSQAIATDTCTHKGTPGNQVVNINGSFYAGEELPIGTVLYQTDMEAGHSGDGVAIYCSASDGVIGAKTTGRMIREPSGPPSAVSGSSITGGIYPTNVPGIGVAVTLGNHTTQSITSSEVFIQDMPQSVFYRMYTQLWLIKTGPIPSGSTLNGASFPTFQAYVTSNHTVIGLPFIFGTLQFSGSMNIITKTCQTSSYNVDMGTYKSSEFSGIGSTTPWVDASIHLTNCPQFLGYHYNQYVNGSGVPSGSDYTANLFKVEVRSIPSSSADGIISVGTTSGDGIISAGSATGVGLQLGYSTRLNGDPASPTNIWKPGSKWSIDVPKNTPTNVRIPLSARYKQTKDKVTPGNANTKVVFTISYY
ncbi:fimbrial protein [Aeromonas jandaei]|uniref:fimbrial protein n=1 Tax=Aeromonas jandaei TaxID=650 RepID=UPI003084122A